MIDYDNRSNKMKTKNDFNQTNLFPATKLDSDIRSTIPNRSTKTRSKSVDLLKSQTRNNNNKMRKVSTKNSSRKIRIYSVDLNREKEDPSNDGVKDEIERIIHFYRQIDQLKNDFSMIEKKKREDRNIIENICAENSDTKVNYKYTPHLKGLDKLIEDFLIINKLRKANNFSQYDKNKSINNSINLSRMNMNTHSTIPKKANNNFILNTTNSYLATKKNQTNAIVSEKISQLESYYNYLGHEPYIKLVNSFEKFCNYGKTVSNMQMDYSQFTNFMAKNNLICDEIKKSNIEIAFNKIKNNNKSINFSEFLNVLVEIAKTEFPFENNNNKLLNYFFNKRLIGSPSMAKTDEEKNFERWYFFLESNEIRKEVLKNLGFFFKLFNKYKVKDFKLGEVMDVNEMIKFCKDLTIIPTFLSSKDVVNVNLIIRFFSKNEFFRKN